MTRILHRPSFGQRAVDVPTPPSWEPAALAAYEQGYHEGTHSRLENSRRELGNMETKLIDAVDRCLAAVNAATETMCGRLLDVAELFVTTALRHAPEAGTAGMLVRVGEVLRAFEPGAMELSVAFDLVDDVAAIMASRGDCGGRVVVSGASDLVPGEFRLHSEWADADGTFDRYLEAARTAFELATASAP
ncbi:MAG: hypothetical protein HY826_13485 [Actinobacteria bacterium]|nr:hypothetical protein [Actinomycetota bacterium]